MEKRKAEIGFVLSMIQNLCEEAEICLVAREIKGTLGVAIVDTQNGKEYVMTKPSEEKANIDKALSTYKDCLDTWIDLPRYVYTEEYKSAFVEFIKPRLERENVEIVNLVYMILEHETGDKRPYFEFDRRS